MSCKSLDEHTLLNHAVRVEQDGYRFYVHLAKVMSEKKLMDLFYQFAEDELRHEQTFKKMMADGTFTNDSSISEAEPLLNRFLVDMDHFGAEQLEKGLSGKLNRNELLAVAIQLEKDSILYYSSLKGRTNKEQIVLLEAIIDEEFRHLSRLFAIRQGEVETDISGIDDI